MINVLIGKGMCGFGVHSVSVWEFCEEDKRAQDGVWQRCDAKREQTKHEYPKRGGRVARTTCRRCKQRAKPREGATDLFFGGSDGGGGNGGGVGE